MSIETTNPPASDDSLCVCISCDKARIDTEQWGDYKIEALLDPQLQITHGLCPRCESRLHHSLGLMSRLQAF